MLSDPSVIDLLNREFNAVELNLTDQGFPPWLEALAPFKAAYDAIPQSKRAFNTPAVVDPEGVVLLGHGDTGAIVQKAKQDSVNFDTARYLQMLETSVKRNSRLEALRGDPALSAEDRASSIAALRLEVLQELERMFKSQSNIRQMGMMR